MLAINSNTEKKKKIKQNPQTNLEDVSCSRAASLQPQSSRFHFLVGWVSLATEDCLTDTPQGVVTRGVSRGLGRCVVDTAVPATKNGRAMWTS